MPEDYPDQFDDVMDFIQATIKRLKRSPDKQMAVLPRRERNRQAAAANPENSRGKGRRGQRGRNRGCVLTAIHLNVTDLGLGYETKEELIFRYCSGSCDAAETMYDKILKNLSRNRRLANDKVGQACCRPIAFDDDLSFLDDSLVYHILRKHSAKRFPGNVCPEWKMRTKETEEQEEQEEEEEDSHCGSLVEGAPATENWTGERENRHWDSPGWQPVSAEAQGQCP
ncbi:Glial cell line-derived neurotrophic factor [Galemys pyrenaicus]|uniref:Glial cell line-derived neurotrophic factor n=1 Tax=Galemys pyrenaicus TaxID=202257 RepID=A0A8J6A8K4_GALPY|nr:Glial cell line-derived neurotrophic factor [Galemys pyrenaicus]